MEDEKQKSLEESYLDESRKQFFKLPAGECYIEFLSDGQRKDITYKEGDVKSKICYMVNVFDKHGLKLAENIDFPMPRTILDAISELRSQHGGTVVNGWLKVKREGADLLTKYQAYPQSGMPTW